MPTSINATENTKKLNEFGLENPVKRKTSKSIIVKTTFNAKHFWKDAPEEVSFLRIPHDHIFFIEAEIEVKHDDRELEFFLVKRKLDDFIDLAFNNKTFELSCEQIADKLIGIILHHYGERKITVTVYEDNNNGGRVKYD